MENSEAICSQRKPRLAQCRPTLPYALGRGKGWGYLGAAGKNCGGSTIHSPTLSSERPPSAVLPWS